MNVTKEWIDYQTAPYGKIAHIPAGVPVTPATNLPQGGYWVEAWPGMNEQAESWQRTYGFHVTEEQVTDSSFYLGQRVRILPCHNYPPTKAPGGIRYGIIQGATQTPGMYLMNGDLGYPHPTPQNKAGEWAYCVASYASPNAGAMWFTAKGLQPMRRDVKK